MVGAASGNALEEARQKLDRCQTESSRRIYELQHKIQSQSKEIDALHEKIEKLGTAGGSAAVVSAKRVNAKEKYPYPSDVIPPVVRNKKNGDLKILLYVTTHMSMEHIWYLKSCWPEALKHSVILRSADVAVYLNSKVEHREEDKKILSTTFKHNNLDIYERENLGWQKGAMAALSDATTEGWFRGYDWVIRLNPDVIIRDESFLLDTMQNDPDATALFINCVPGIFKIHTDFFAIKPALLEPHAFTRPAHRGAERSFTHDVRQVILDKGGHRFIPGANPATVDCRAGEKKKLTDTPITHYHFSLEHEDDDDWIRTNFTCPIPFV